MEPTLYGFEDYKMYKIDTDFLDYTYYTNNNAELSVYPYYHNYYIFADGVVKIKGPFGKTNYNLGEIKDHKELLETAKKVYIHKNCSISRTLVSSKYKKTLDPWMADVVVVPKPDLEEGKYYSKWSTPVVIFSNDSAKILVIRNMGEYSTSKTDNAFENAAENTRLGDLIPSNLTLKTYYGTTPCEEEILRDSVLIYKGDILCFDEKELYMMDIFTNSIPRDKIVYENTIQSSLGTEENQVTFESLLSIYDMLQSKDNDSVNAGLKALAMMDYAHYPNSIKYMLNRTEGRYRWCNAFSSAAVKFMFKTISNDNRVRRGMYLGDGLSIYKEDFELYKELLMHFNKDDDRPLSDQLRYTNFMTVTPEGMLVPRLVETA